MMLVAVSDTPEDLYYVSTHEWVLMDADGVATVGITDFAQSELGDIVYVQLPEEGIQVSARDEVSVVESVKTAADIYAPVSGEIIQVNARLDDSPEIINELPYDDGWIMKIRVSDEAELEELLSAEDYKDSIDEE